MSRNAPSIIGSMLLAATAAGTAFAQDYPSRPIAVVIAQNPGGTADITGRLVADFLRDGFKATVVAENKGGASGSIATSFVKQQAPDGYTLLVQSNSLALQPAAIAKPLYDPVKDLAPIAMVASVPTLIVVRKDSPFRNLGDLVKYAKESPTKLNWGHGGIGTFGWYQMRRFVLETGIQVTDVPYTSGGAAQIGLLGDQVDLVIDTPLGVGKFVKDGSMRALATSGEERAWQTPDAPTGKEQELPFRGVSWIGVLTNAGTDPKIVNQIYEQIRLAVARPEVKERMRNLGMDITLQDPATFGRTIADDFAGAKDIITKLKIPLQ